MKKKAEKASFVYRQLVIQKEAKCRNDMLFSLVVDSNRKRIQVIGFA